MTKKEIYEQVVGLTAELAQNKVAEQIFSAATEGDAVKTQQIIDGFPTRYPELSQKIVSFGRKFNELVGNVSGSDGYLSKTRHKGEIFGEKANDSNGIYVFDTRIIDTLSFYVLTIFGNIPDVYFLYTEDNDFQYLEAIHKATNEAFGNFVACYNLVDCVGKDKEYQTVGQILVAALAGELEEPE